MMLAFVASVGCSDGPSNAEPGSEEPATKDEDPDPPSIDDEEPEALVAPPVIQQIPVEGGTVTVPSGGGATLTIEFPPGALREPVELTVTPEALSEGQLFRAAVVPRQMLFAAPVRLRLELPAELAPNSQSSMHFGGMFVGVKVDPDQRTVDAEVLVWGSLTRSLGWFTLAAKPEANGSDLQIEQELDLIAKIEEARSLLDEMEIQPDILLAVSLNELLNDLDTRESSPDVERFLQEAVDRACNGARDVQADLELIDGYEQLKDKALPVSIWEGVLLHANRDSCNVAPATEALEPLFDSADAFYDGPAPTAVPGSDAWDALLGELDDAAELGLMVNALDVPGVQEMLSEKLISRLIDSLRGPAWDMGRDEGDQRPLGELLRRVPGNEDLLADIQTCGTVVEYESRDSGGSALANGVGLVQGSRPPEVSILEATVPARSDGTVVPGGSVRAVMCKSGHYDDEQLVVTLDGVEVTRLDHQNGEYFSPAPTFLVTDLLDAAGVPPEEADEHRLAFSREGTGCGGDYGSGSNELAALLLQIQPGEVDILGVYVGVATFPTITYPWKIMIRYDSTIPDLQEIRINEDGTEAFWWYLWADNWFPPEFTMVAGSNRCAGEVTFDDAGVATLKYQFYDIAGHGNESHTFVGTRE